MLESLEKLLEDRDITFDAVDRRIMCFAHIVDLCSKQVTSSIGMTADNGDDSDDENAGSDPISRARALVRIICGSGKRRQAFEDVIGAGNSGKWFMKGDPPHIVEVDNLQLLRAVRTQWDSIYQMLNRLRAMRPV